MSWRGSAETTIGHTGFKLEIVAAVMAIMLAYVKLSMVFFAYWLPTAVLLGFSLYWIRDVVVRTAAPIGLKKAAMRVDGENTQKMESNPR